MNMARHNGPLVLLLASALLVTSLGPATAPAQAQRQAQDVQPPATPLRTVATTPTGGTSLDWQEGWATGTAYGTANRAEAANAAQALILAEQAARAAAYAKLGECLGSVYITEDITVSSALVENSVLSLTFAGFVNNAQILKTDLRFLEDGSPWVTVTVGVPMAGEHPGTQAAPPEVPKEEQPSATASQALYDVVVTTEVKLREKGQAGKFKPQPGQGAGREEKDYTGLIVDATGLGGTPAISPKIITPDGAEVWGTLDVTPEYAISYGLAAWGSSVEAAKGVARVGPTPLVLRAVEARGPGVSKCKFVVSPDDAAFLKKMNDRTHFLDKCAVVIAVG